ncbi:MAG: MFS transporter, partial [Thermoplasmata archaeon]
WRYIFFINVPVGLISLYFGIKYIGKGKILDKKLDISGMVTLSASLVFISYAATDFASHGLDMLNAAMIMAGIIFAIIFVYIEMISKSQILPLNMFSNRIFSFSIFASFFQSLGFLSVTFIVIMYLQGIRGLSPMESSLLLVPGYVLGGFTGPVFGKLSDRIGARIPATLGMFLMAIAILFYMTLNLTSSIYLIIPISIVSGLGSSMFFPANNSAVMASSSAKTYGAASGILRTMASIGQLGSFVLAISIASASIPRSVAFEVFAGVGKLEGGVSAEFLVGIRHAFIVSLAIIFVGMFLSYVRGKENRKKRIANPEKSDSL